MPEVRAPAVAGMFYPADAEELRTLVDDLLAKAAGNSADASPKAIIAPHAGYVYSGPIAASAYASLKSNREVIKRVILLGPAHRVPVHGLVLPASTGFATPLGTVAMDVEGFEAIRDLPQVRVSDDAHMMEHSLEVHLPFLQEMLEEFRLVPLVVGSASAEEVAEVLERLWGGPETLVVISSDLSHYQDYQTAQGMDRATSDAIEQLAFEEIHSDQACGRAPVSGLLLIARRLGLQGKTIDLRNSGDTAGSREQVVGYGAYVFH